MKQLLLNMLKLIKKSLNQLYAFIPTAVPVGMTESEAWANDIINTYDFPNNDSVRFALNTMILHSGPTAAYVSKRHFSLCVKASMAKQIAGANFQNIKLKQKAAEEAAKLAEATASLQVADVPPQLQN